jgi:LPXTG-motif cell wall-anchored protein
MSMQEQQKLKLVLAGLGLIGLGAWAAKRWG